MAIQDNASLLQDVVARLNAATPNGWTFQTGFLSDDPRDAGLVLTGPDEAKADVAVVCRPRLEPREVKTLPRPRPPQGRPPDPLVIAPFLSPRVQQRLREAGFNYADATGNIRVAVSSPAIFIQTTGATDNPEPEQRPRRSLKGAKAARVVRALVDRRTPLGLRELARFAEVDAGYASRVVEFLDREALVTRTVRGPITAVDWVALLRRWAQEYSPYDRRRVRWYLAPRGLNDVLERLRVSAERYAVSGSWAAAQYAPVAPPRNLLVYASLNARGVAALDLRPADAGANVSVTLPFDDVIFERTSAKRGVCVAAPSQVVVDLLSSPGRGPAEAEALINWMREHADVWQA